MSRLEWKIGKAHGQQACYFIATIPSLWDESQLN